MIAICPHCEAVLIAHENIDDDGSAPAHGDLSVCANCSEVSIYDLDSPTLLRPPITEEEKTHIAACPGARKARAEITIRNDVT